MNKRIFSTIFGVFALTAALAGPARANLNILACEPEWAALVQELGGDKVTVSSATTSAQDPHHVQARPSLLAKARRADLLVCTGAELEVGWLPVLQRESGNPRILPGKPGHFEAADYVTMLEKPTRLDRAEGDVHPEGNPHIQTDPRNFSRVAVALAKRLAELDPANAGGYAEREKDFERRWQQAIQKWQSQAAPLKGMPVISQHKLFSYLYAWLGLRETAVLEPKPGMEPTVAHLSSVLATQKAQPAKVVIYADYQSPRASEWIASRTGIPAVALPASVTEQGGRYDLFGWFDTVVGRLLAVRK